jgi:hypothetical protein
MTTECDLDEVKHQLKQEVLELLESGASWEGYLESYAYGFKCGKFEAEETLLGVGYLSHRLLVRVSQYKTATLDSLLTDMKKDDFDTESLAFKVFSHAREQQKERERKQLCEELTKVLGKNNGVVTTAASETTDSLTNFLGFLKRFIR